VVDAKHSTRSSKKAAATETTTILVAAAPRETPVLIQDCNKPFSSSCKAGCSRLPLCLIIISKKFLLRFLVKKIFDPSCGAAW
jgi:hypothetical protein